MEIKLNPRQILGGLIDDDRAQIGESFQVKAVKAIRQHAHEARGFCRIDQASNIEGIKRFAGDDPCACGSEAFRVKNIEAIGVDGDALVTNADETSNVEGIKFVTNLNRTARI